MEYGHCVKFSFLPWNFGKKLLFFITLLHTFDLMALARIVRHVWHVYSFHSTVNVYISDTCPNYLGEDSQTLSVGCYSESR